MAHIFTSPIRDNNSSAIRSRGWAYDVQCQSVSIIDNCFVPRGPTSAADVLISEISSIIWLVALKAEERVETNDGYVRDHPRCVKFPE